MSVLELGAVDTESYYRNLPHRIYLGSQFLHYIASGHRCTALSHTETGLQSRWDSYLHHSDHHILESHHTAMPLGYSQSHQLHR